MVGLVPRLPKTWFGSSSSTNLWQSHSHGVSGCGELGHANHKIFISKKFISGNSFFHPIETRYTHGPANDGLNSLKSHTFCRKEGSGLYSSTFNQMSQWDSCKCSLICFPLFQHDILYFESSVEGHVHLNGRECLLKYSISLDSMPPGTTEVSHKDNENHNDFSIHSYLEEQ